MNNIIKVYLCVVCLFVETRGNYWTQRAALIDSEYSEQIGGKLNLSAEEHKANNIIQSLKQSELVYGFTHPESFLPSLHFFKSRSRIEESDVFKIIKQLPKGSSLHSHDLALVSEEYVYNLTFSKNLYACERNGRLQLGFPGFKEINNKTCKWQLVEFLRQQNSSFDSFLRTQISIIVDDPVTSYPTVNDAWDKFSDTFVTLLGMLLYKPVFVDYFYQALKELYEDNVFYLEFRTTLPTVYDSNGTTYSPKEVVQIYYNTLNAFKRDHPSFHGARLIFAPNRHVSNKTMNDYVQTAYELKQLFPDFVAGFDLVAQEDKGQPLDSFIPELLDMSQHDIKFFFHAGETDWNGSPTDFNLIDAVLLNTTRIGHGFALLKHPEVMKIIKQRKIAVEVCPISNQVLKLVDDIRNHPGSVLISLGFPMVICCDDPSFWGAKGLSYDWYMAFMGMSSWESDLKFLKQLAINSIQHSSMPETEKSQAFTKWQLQWNRFINNVTNNKQLKEYFATNVYNVNNV